jgi:chromatin segregation and condensation protein Rec8/ScpA/Scc1 (kleisin family)
MEQMVLDGWFLRQDIVERLLSTGSENDEASAFGDRIMRIAAQDGAEHQALSDPIDRSIALVLSLVREEGLNAWDIDLEAFLEIFTERVRTEAERVDLPACGRLIRLAWEVLHEQTLGVYDRATSMDLAEEEMDFGHDFGWELDVDDEAFAFTTTVLQGEADATLPSLFDGRLRRPEGRPTTLGELLAAFKDAADDAEALQERERVREAAAAELKAHLDDVGGRMHDEDLEGDIERCWNALRQVCKANGSAKVPLLDVVRRLEEIDPEAAASLGGRTEANVAAFIAGLFLVHRRLADVVQDQVPSGPIHLVDLWPKMDAYHDVRAHLERLEAEEDGRVPSGLLQRAGEAAALEEASAAVLAESEEDTESWLVE